MLNLLPEHIRFLDHVPRRWIAVGIEESGQRSAAAAGKARVRRNSRRVLRVVGRAQGLVVGGPEVAVYPAEIADRHRHAWQDFLLHAERELPVVRPGAPALHDGAVITGSDRKSTRLNSSHSQISYAVFCLKK